MIGVLLGFEIQQTAVTCDIKEVPCSFHANREHRNFLRFPLSRDTNLNEENSEYRTIVHLLFAFRVCVNRQFWPQSATESGQDSFEQEPAKFLKNEFYVGAY